eukprot:COSAG04_NODE_11644_length_697_cov_0.804348_1_plen_32_part_10
MMLAYGLRTAVTRGRELDYSDVLRWRDFRLEL